MNRIKLTYGLLLSLSIIVLMIAAACTAAPPPPAPSIVITSPANGATLPAGDVTVSVQVTNFDPAGVKEPVK